MSRQVSSVPARNRVLDRVNHLREQVIETQAGVGQRDIIEAEIRGLKYAALVIEEATMSNQATYKGIQPDQARLREIHRELDAVKAKGEQAGTELASAISEIMEGMSQSFITPDHNQRYDLVGTRTGRFSCDGPNLSNTPKSATDYLEVDFKEMEVRTLAFLTTSDRSDAFKEFTLETLLAICQKLAVSEELLSTETRTSADSLGKAADVASEGRVVGFNREPVSGDPSSVSVITRDVVVAEAKSDISDMLKTIKLVLLKDGNSHRFNPLSDELRFTFHPTKRRIKVSLLVGSQKKSIKSAFAKCSPDDCYNKFIGMAIALRRLLKRPIPTKYFKLPPVDGVRTGDTIKSTTMPLGWTGKITSVGLSIVRFTGADGAERTGSKNKITVIDDTNRYI